MKQQAAQVKSIPFISGFGTAPEQVKNGYVGCGETDCGTDKQMLEKYDGMDVCLVRGANFAGTDEFEFYIMKRENSCQSILTH